MQAVRHLLAQRLLAVLICAVALSLKLLVPGGYMIDSDHGRLAVTPCSGLVAHEVARGMPGMHGAMPGHGEQKDHAKAELPCAFSGLSAASLGAVDPVRLVAHITFIMAVGLAGTLLPAPSGPMHLRPPLRGPPANP